MPRFSLLFVPLLLLGLTLPVAAENWPEFRGPTGQGHYAGKNLPSEWSKTKNVAWKTVLPGKGWSSPIVNDGRIYLTAAIPIKDSKDQSLTALCVDAGKGTILWQTEVFRQDGGKTPRIHGKNSYASPTPLTDGQRLYVHFGHEGTAALDLNGKVQWRNRDLRYKPVHGNGGTPILVDGRLIFSADGSDMQFVVALDKTTGKVVWKSNRNTKAAKKFSFGTPLLITVNNQQQIISPASDAVMAYDPADGREIWRVRYDGYSVIPRPVYGHGMVFLSSGYDRPTFYAIRADGAGDVTDTHIVWKTSKAAPHTPSPLLVGDEVYTVSDLGVASCFNARSGKVHWQERIPGGYSASPMYADGKVYFQSEQGVTTVVQAATQFKVLASNQLGERTFATYAVADGVIYLRTETLLYRIQAK